jgi:PEP-CTERM motif-containing protein
MKIQRFLPVSILLLSCGLISAEAARAGTVLYDSASIISGQGGASQALDLSTAGTLTITVTNIPWLDVVSELTSFLSTTSGVVGGKMYAAGSETISVGPGTYYASWFGDAQGTYNEGVIGVKIQWQPVNAVPLPASLVLLISGLGVLFGWQHRRTPDLAYCKSIPTRR